MSKLNKSGRVRLICIKCEKEFSTHSSNRRHCHKCIPKCKEKHFFYKMPNKKEGKLEKDIEQ